MRANLLRRDAIVPSMFRVQPFVTEMKIFLRNRTVSSVETADFQEIHSFLPQIGPSTLERGFQRLPHCFEFRQISVANLVADKSGDRTQAKIILS